MSAIPMEWTVLERLLLAQAVHKYGEDDWTQVARTLKQHPLLQGQARLEVFNQKNCSLQYYLMLEDMDNESRRQSKPPNTVVTQDIPKVVKLARQLYFQRVDELNKAIKQDEDRFMAILSEIDDIKSGAMDQELTNLANDQQGSLTFSNAEKIDETTTEVAQQGIDAQESMDNQMMLAGDNTCYDETTKEPTPTPETDLSIESSNGATIPQQQSEEGVYITQTLKSQPYQDTETTPTPSINMNNVVITRKSGTPQPVDSSMIDQPTEFTTVSITAAQDDQNSDQMTTTSQTKDGIEEDNTNNYSKGDMNEASSSGQETHTTVIDETFTDEAPQSTDFGTKRPSNDNDSSMDQGLPFDSASKRPRLDQSSADHPPSPPTTFFDHQDVGNITRKFSTAHNDLSNKIPSTIETKPSELQRNSQPSYIPSLPAPSPLPMTTTFSERPSTSVTLSPQLPSPSNPPAIQTISERASKPTSELAPIEPLPIFEVEAAKQTILNSNSTDENVRLTEATVFDNGEKPWVTDGEDVDGTESVTESDSNTATPNTTTTTSSPEKRRSGSTGINKDDPRQKSWQKHINLLWRDIANHKNGTMFMNPIKEIQAPLYYDVVKHPLDLKTIKNRIRDGTIRTTVEFERDVVLMLANSLMYNKEGTEIYQMALEMLQDVTEQIKIFKTAYGDSSAHTRSPSVLANGQQKSQPSSNIETPN